MKKQIFKGLLCITVLTLSVWACTKDNSATNQEDITPQNLVFTDAQKDEARDFFAQTLAKACKDEVVQTFLKEEALKKMNGDYEVLYMVAKNNKLSNGKTFATVLQEQADKDLRKRDSQTTEDFFKSFTEKIDPLLTIYLYAPDGKSVKDWDIKTTKEVTLCLPSIDDEKEINLGTYRVDGSKGSVSVKTRPKDFYLVVRANERYKVKPKNGQELVSRCSDISCDCPYIGSYYIVIPVNCDPDNPNPNPNNPNPSSGITILAPATSKDVQFTPQLLNTRSGSVCTNGNSDRDNKTSPEHCYQYTFDSANALDNVEPWANGSPEMYCIVESIFGSNGNAFTKVAKYYLPEINRIEYFNFSGSWWSPIYTPKMVSTSESQFARNMQSIVWNKSVFASLMKYTWREEDGGPSIDFSIGASFGFDALSSVLATLAGVPAGNSSTSSFTTKTGVSLGLTIKDLLGRDDDDAGEQIVNYCDIANGAGSSYSTGRISFSVKHLD
jgi:hypothetical protein